MMIYVDPKNGIDKPSLSIDVDSLREKLMYLIDDKQGDLIDAEVVNLSRVLNATLNQYNKVIEEKLKRQEL